MMWNKISDMWESMNTITVAGNEMWRIAALFASILGALIIGRILRYYLQKSSDKLTSGSRPLTGAFMASLASAVLYVALMFGLSQGLNLLSVSEKIVSFIDSIMGVLWALTVGYVIYRMVDVVQEWLKRAAERTQSKMDDMLVPLVTTSLRVTIIVMVLIQIAQTLSNQPLTSIIASLGVGGLAVALAAQDTIKNFFGSLVIFADKPFELGERIVVDGHDGPVEEVGFRSTKIRTLDGHQITIPNGELANKTIQNIGRRPFIKRVAEITITYDTPPEKVQRAVDIIKELLDNHEGMNPELPPRVYFNDFNDASLNILVIYWFHPPDYWAALEFGEKFNMELLKRYNEEGIEFAFPTQTLYLAGDPNRPLSVSTE